MRRPSRAKGGGVGAPCRAADDRRPLQSVVTLLNGVRGRSVEGRIVPVMGLHPQVEEVGGGGVGQRKAEEEERGGKGGQR